MPTPYWIQTAGTLAVAGTFAAADLPARLLAVTPGSEVLWYLQIGVFAPFRHVLNLFGHDVSGILSSYLLPLALVVVVFAVAACAARQRLVVAVFSNCSAIVVAATAYMWCVRADTPLRTASLASMVAESKIDLALLVMLLAVSLVAALASHVVFLREVRSGLIG